MNTKKRIISIILSSLLIITCLVPNIVFAWSLRERIEVEVREDYINDPMFILETKEKGNVWAETFLNHIVERRLQKAITPLGDPDAIQQVSMTAIEQLEEFDCGAASTLMTLYTAGRASAVPGTTNAQKMRNLYEPTGIDEQAETGSIVIMIRDTINSYMTSGKENYAYLKLTSKTKFVDKIHDSLRQGYAVILRAHTTKLPYWDGFGDPDDDGHYIAAYYINTNSTSNTIKVADSYNGKYCSQSPYLNTFGKHTLSIDAAYSALKEYIIFYE
jgi:hypothetical protein